MRLITTLLCWQLALALLAADSATNEHSSFRSLTNAVALTPGPNDANIARVAATILEKGHYLKMPFNDEVSSKFLDRYFDSLDNLHIYFTQEIRGRKMLNPTLNRSANARLAPS